MKPAEQDTLEMTGQAFASGTVIEPFHIGAHAACGGKPPAAGAGSHLGAATIKPAS